MRKDKDGICLNIGCGLSFGKNWINIDCSPSLLITKFPLIGKVLTIIFNFPKWPEDVHYGNIIKSNLLPINSCELIFASHVLEHLSYSDAKLGIQHLYKFLKPSGTLRLIVPDLEVCIKKYISRRETGDEKAADLLMQELGMGLTSSRKSLLSRAREALANSRHQWMYDSNSLIKLLSETGFVGITLSGYGEWADERFAEIEEKERHDNSICIEASKGSISGGS